MDTSGNIRELLENEEPKINEIKITKDEAEKFRRKSKRIRKNNMRNKPCPCGSGKKFKKCCWTQVTKMQEVLKGDEND